MEKKDRRKLMIAMLMCKSLECILDIHQLNINKAASLLSHTSTTQLTDITRLANHQNLIQASSFQHKHFHTSVGTLKWDTTLEMSASQFPLLKSFFLINKVNDDKTQCGLGRDSKAKRKVLRKYYYCCNLEERNFQGRPTFKLCNKSIAAESQSYTKSLVFTYAINSTI